MHMSRHSDYYYTRRFLAFVCFVVAIGCGVGFFVTGMSHYILLVLSIVLLILTYLIAPNARGRRNGSSYDWSDLFLDEWIISAFFYLISLPFRILGLIFRHILD